MIADLILRHYTFFISDAYFSGWCVSVCARESRGSMMNDGDCCLLRDTAQCKEFPENLILCLVNMHESFYHVR